MIKPRMHCIRHASWLIVFAAQLLAQQTGRDAAPNRLFVEQFTTKSEAVRLHDDLVSELRRVNSVSVVTSSIDADDTLAGGGEIWVRGHRSLNPRNRTPSAENAVYGGYLSVELRNQKGETLWSDLVTPEGQAEDISKQLSRQIAKHVAQVLAQGISPARADVQSQPAVVLKGAGATFPYPVYAKWITNYRRQNPSAEITYDSIGSEAGVRRLLAGELDFGASDNPEAVREIAPDQAGRYLLFPSVVGAVVPIVNLPGFTGDIAFTPEALAGIYLGKIKKWNDPILQRANPRLRLPDLDIVVVHRSDGSGTTYAWTDYLSKTNPEWKTGIGASLAPKWPVGRGGSGNEGVAQVVKEIGGSIGYVEFIYALQNHLSYGKVRNQHGEYVSASLESMAVAVHQSMAIHDDLSISIVDAPGQDAYPISSFTWFVLPDHIADETKRNAIIAFLRWMLGPGQRQAAALGYLALPSDVVAKEEVAISAIR